MYTPVSHFQVCNRGIVWHKKHFPSTLTFFIKGEGKEIDSSLWSLWEKQPRTTFQGNARDREGRQTPTHLFC